MSEVSRGQPEAGTSLLFQVMADVRQSIDVRRAKELEFSVKTSLARALTLQLISMNICIKMGSMIYEYWISLFLVPKGYLRSGTHSNDIFSSHPYTHTSFAAEHHSPLFNREVVSSRFEIRTLA